MSQITIPTTTDSNNNIIYTHSVNAENADSVNAENADSVNAENADSVNAENVTFATYLEGLRSNKEVIESLTFVVNNLSPDKVSKLAKEAKKELGINQLKFFYESSVTPTETTIIDKYNFFSLTLNGIGPKFFEILDRTTGKDNILTKYTVSLTAFTYLLHNVYSYDLPINLLQWACWHRRTDIVLRILSYLSTSSDEYIKLYINYMVPRGIYKGYKAIDFVMIEKPTDQSSLSTKTGSLLSRAIDPTRPVSTLKNIITAIPTLVYQAYRYSADLNTFEIRRLLISYGSDEDSDNVVMNAVITSSKNKGTNKGTEPIYDIIIRTRKLYVDEQEKQKNVILFEIRNGKAYINGKPVSNIELTGLKATQIYTNLEKSDSDDTKNSQTVRNYNKKNINKNINKPPSKGILGYFRGKGGYKKTHKHKPERKNRNVRITKRSV
jgi:hypothetical protein